jgi:uncharacterized protein (TIGR04255 family)
LKKCRRVKGGDLSEYPVFKNAPIIEALLDVRVELPKQVDLKTLEAFYGYVQERFPERQERKFFKAEFKFPPGIPPASVPTSSETVGYLFRSPIEKKIVQARLDGFTFNKLNPYENWKLFCSEARNLWNLYLQIASPLRVTRIAARYINRIDIPLPMKDFKDYILTVPEIAPNVPQALAHFFMRLVIPNPEIQATAVIVETMETPIDNQRLSLILDIDVWRETVYENNQPEMWDDFERLRVFKNNIFFNSITEKTKELFR